VIAGLKSRERVDGLIELIKPVGLKRGDRVRISRGPFVGHLALFDGMKPRERCEVLLALLGAPQRVALARQDIEAVG
jgi:transcription antitermination factor NusG